MADSTLVLDFLKLASDKPPHELRSIGLDPADQFRMASDWPVMRIGTVLQIRFDAFASFRQYQPQT